MCVPFQYCFQKQRLKAELPLVILLVLLIGKVRVTRNMPAACSFCASLSFQKDKEIAKEEQSHVNTTLAFAVLPRKIRKEAKQVKDDNGLPVATYTSTCQEHSKPSCGVSTAAPSWTIS